MSRLSRLACLFVIFLSPLTARADEGRYAIKADDGTIIANHQVPAKFEALIEKMRGVVVLGNPRGKVTLNEFYDLNCPYCRRASGDIDALLHKTKELRLVLVPFPVLGIPSIQASRVELAVQQIASPHEFYAFYRKVMSSRGVMDGQRAFALSQALGFDDKSVADVANDKGVTDMMISHVRLGNGLGIQATPGFVIAGVAINGYPGPNALARLVKAVEHCGKVVCSGE